MTKTIYATEEDLNKFASLTEILHFQDLAVIGQEFHEMNDTLVLLCIPRWSFAVCPDCGQVSTKIHDYPNQRNVHDSPIRGYHTLLVYDSRRFVCEHCNSEFMEVIRDIVSHCTYTHRLMNEIADPERKQDVSTLAKVYGLGYKLVESVLFKAAELKLAERAQAPIQVKQLGIDEIANRKGQGDYKLVLTDLERRILLDVLLDRNKQTLIDWLTSPPPGVDLSSLATVATDLWTHYRDAVQNVYDHVAVVADRFHVMQNLNKAIHDSRREAQRQAKNDEEKSKLKGLRYTLIKNKPKLKDSENIRLAALAKSHPHLYRLCELRQQLHDWYEKELTPEQAKVPLQKWIEDAKSLGLSHLDKFCKTLTNWQTEIVNFFAHRVTSGFVEGMNSKIRLLKRIAFGLPNFEHFRLRMLWACG